MVDRAKKLVEAWVNVLVLDSAHGHSKWIIDTVKNIKAEMQIDIIAWNIATWEAAKDLIEAGADAIKVWIWPGSICTTRIVAWVWYPQLSAIEECVTEAQKHNIPVVADWWIKYSWDVAKALAAWASTVMMWSVLGATTESPGEIIRHNGQNYKTYRWMWSIGAMTKGSSDRYFQEWTAKEKLVPEWVEAMVPFKWDVSSTIFQFIWWLRSSMWYLWAKDIENFWKNAEFVEITAAGLAESHVHDVTIINESPNYSC
jgi:IMP dehydrogenase